MPTCRVTSAVVTRQALLNGVSVQAVQPRPFDHPQGREVFERRSVQAARSGEDLGIQNR